MPPQVAGLHPDAASVEGQEMPLLTINAGRWDAIFYDGRQTALEQALPDYLRSRRWFGAKARTIKNVTVGEFVPLPYAEGLAYLAFVTVQYAEDGDETYFLPIAYAGPQRARSLIKDARHAIIARLAINPDAEPGVIFDPLSDQEFARALLDLIVSHRRLRGAHGGEVSGFTIRASQPLPVRASSLDPRSVSAEQSNSSIVFGSDLIMKIFRKIEPGINPDLEIGRYFTEDHPFPYTPPTVGALEYLRSGEAPTSLAILQGYAPNQGDAWEYTLEAAGRSYDAVCTRADLALPETTATAARLLAAAGREPGPLAREVVGDYLEQARLLGERTADMHLALAASDDPAFAPEDFSTDYQCALYRRMRGLTERTFQHLRHMLPHLPATVRRAAEATLALEDTLMARFRRVTVGTIEAARTRIHGDFHLGQVLYTGNDFMIIDFEGEPIHPIGERRMKHSPLRDVAGMLRSFQYAAYTTLLNRTAGATLSAPLSAPMRRWADFWHFETGAAYLGGYLRRAAGAPFIPPNPADLETLLEVFILEKLVYEIDYEMNNRPTWLSIPLTGILRQVDACHSYSSSESSPYV